MASSYLHLMPWMASFHISDLEGACVCNKKKVRFMAATEYILKAILYVHQQLKYYLDAVNSTLFKSQ